MGESKKERSEDDEEENDQISYDCIEESDEHEDQRSTTRKRERRNPMERAKKNEREKVEIKKKGKEMIGQCEVKIWLLYTQVEIYMQCICSEKSDLLLFIFCLLFYCHKYKK